MMEWHGRKMAWREWIHDEEEEGAFKKNLIFFFYFFLLCFPFFWLGFTFYFFLVVLCFIHHVTRERKNGCRWKKKLRSSFLKLDFMVLQVTYIGYAGNFLSLKTNTCCMCGKAKKSFHSIVYKARSSANQITKTNSSYVTKQIRNLCLIWTFSRYFRTASPPHNMTRKITWTKYLRRPGTIFFAASSKQNEK